jgi:hypothetical protein
MTEHDGSTDHFTSEGRHSNVSAASSGYRPPTITRLGDLAELTQGKEPGGADGTTFLGIDIGTV